MTKYGIPISDFKASLADSEYMNCECALALYDVSVYKAIGFKLYCAPNGNYETIQCVGGSCACVNEHGDPLGHPVDSSGGLPTHRLGAKGARRAALGLPAILARSLALVMPNGDSAPKGCT